MHESEGKEAVCQIITNEEYREKIKYIFDKIEDNKKLRFWYKYISGIEEG